MPLRHFWFLNKQIDRLNAEDDMRQLNLIVATNSSEGIQQIQELLNKQIGTVAKFERKVLSAEDIDPNELDPEFDRAGFQALKASLAAGR